MKGPGRIKSISSFTCMIFIIIFVTMPLACNAIAASGNSNTSTNLTDANLSPITVPEQQLRQVFSSPKWEVDHVSILVNNSGGPIEVQAYIDDRSNVNIIPIKAGENRKVSTNPIIAETGQIVNFGFMAYENGTLIDSREGTFTVIQTPTPTPLPPETASLKGTIVDAITNNPVVGAEVIIVSKTYDKQYPTAITDEYGSFKLDKMYPDKYSITVKATGYKPAYLDVDRIEGDEVLSDITLEKYAIATATPTPTPAPEQSVIQGWIYLLTSPQACVAFISSTVAVIVSLTVIYEWLQRQKERRKKEGQ